MKRALRSLVCTLLAVPVLACGQPRAALRLDLAPGLPPPVAVGPGVAVVPDQSQEIFYSDGYYWTRVDGYWYEAADPYGTWTYVPQPGVPALIIQEPPGRFRRWHAGERFGTGFGGERREGEEHRGVERRGGEGHSGGGERGGGERGGGEVNRGGTGYRGPEGNRVAPPPAAVGQGHRGEAGQRGGEGRGGEGHEGGER